MKTFISIFIAMLFMSFGFGQTVDRPVKPTYGEEVTPIAKTTVSPNPVSYYLRIHTLGWSPKELVLFDSKGKVVHHESSSGTMYVYSTTVDVRRLESGYYVLLVMGHEHYVRHKVIIKQRVQNFLVEPGIY